MRIVPFQRVVTKTISPSQFTRILTNARIPRNVRSFSLHTRYHADVEHNPSKRTVKPTGRSSSQPSSQAKEKLAPASKHLFAAANPQLIDPIYLRDSCHCSKCIDPSDKQRNFNFWQIPHDIEIDQFELHSNGSCTITWRNDIPGFENHKSVYKIGFLKTLHRRHGNRTRFDRVFTFRRQVWDRDMFSKNTQQVNFEEFMTNGSTFNRAVLQLWQYGLLMLKNVPEKESAVAEIATRLGPLYNTFYGSTWDVKSVPAAKNVAYTSKYLGFHMDLLYMKEPPGYQLLHCLHNSCQGGESRFVDTLKAVDMLLDEDPSRAEVLHKHKLKYQYSNDNHFYTDLKPILQPSLQGEIHQTKGAIRFAELNRIGKVFWSPQFLDSIRGPHPLNNDPTTKPFLAAAKRFAEILETPDIVYETKMEPGQCAIFANLRVAHARNAFDVDSGKRWLRGAYIREQDVLNKVIETAGQPNPKSGQNPTASGPSPA